MKKLSMSMLIVMIGLATLSTSVSVASDNPFVGRWALDVPGGAAWLGIEDKGAYLDASILWYGGSVVPVASVFMNDGQLNITRVNNVVRERDAQKKPTRTQIFTELITADISGDTLYLKRYTPLTDKKGGVKILEFTGKRIPAIPSAPDLSKVNYGKPIKLFNGKNKDGWKLTNPNHVDGWKVLDSGILNNNPLQPKGKHLSYGNLCTERVFEDFKLTTEMMVPKGGNSGIYLRGIYEVQVADTYGREVDSHNMGGLYSRITPSVAAEKPAGEWQTYDITLCDRHLTVILNGTTIIDNQPVLGCTGGALTADEFKPGPIYIQGDHTGVNYRNMILTPIIK